ncbi:MAG: Nramp family divalent metal transporter [Pirellulaceae bacterium]|nr:Nramp family divalent metal transporter [Pirellulaceae bacterium]
MSQAEAHPPTAHLVQEPPLHIAGILACLGPGLIIAGSIVGSGELIATTITGAEAGFWLLWLIVIGCVIKVFVQVELGRDAVSTGKTTMDALSEVPGPAIRGRGNWLLWYWFLMFTASMAQLGGIVGGVGQAMAISVPLTQEGRDFNRYVTAKTELDVVKAESRLASEGVKTAAPADKPAQAERAARLEAEVLAKASRLAELGERPTPSRDDQLWAILIAIITSALLIVGRYRLIEIVTTTMVAAFTLVTVVNVLALQSTESWAITWTDIVNGFSFRLPPASQDGGGTALATALKTFGIIGVGASELVAYPYWCQEKGYARFTGPREAGGGWAERARGWMTVMRWDAWCSMIVYTTATLAFYLLGAAILGRTGLIPKGNELVRTLAVMYEPVFGAWAQLLFLVGAFAVLYSTYFVASAGNARVFSDALRVMGLAAHSPEASRRRVRALSGFLPLLCLAIYLTTENLPERYKVGPEQLVLLSGMMQALMLPMLAAAALYFRYFKCDPRIAPGKVWDFFLWLSSLAMLFTAGILLKGEIDKALNKPAATQPAAVQPATPAKLLPPVEP